MIYNTCVICVVVEIIVGILSGPTVFFYMEGALMQKRVYGRVYDTEASVLLARGTIIDGHTSDGLVRTGMKELYRSDNGRFFVSHTTRWENKRNFIESITSDGAKKLYNILPEHLLPFKEAFDDPQNLIR